MSSHRTSMCGAKDDYDDDNDDDDYDNDGDDAVQFRECWPALELQGFMRCLALTFLHLDDDQCDYFQDTDDDIGKRGDHDNGKLTV